MIKNSFILNDVTNTHCASFFDLHVNILRVCGKFPPGKFPTENPPPPPPPLPRQIPPLPSKFPPPPHPDKSP